MTLKLVLYAWLVAVFGILIFLFVIAPGKILSKLIKGEKISRKTTYSYYQVIKTSAIFSLVFTVISLAVYLESQSSELSITMFVFFQACTISGCLRILHLEKLSKDSGAKKQN